MPPFSFILLLNLFLIFFLSIFSGYQNDAILLQSIWKMQANIKTKTQITHSAVTQRFTAENTLIFRPAVLLGTQMLAALG